MPLPDQQTVLAAAERAPEYVQQVIQSSDTIDTIIAIGHANQLHVDMIGTLARANTAMVLGLISPSEFISYLTQAGVAPASASQIAREVNEKIFKPLREKLRGEPASASAVKGADAPATAGSAPRPAPNAAVYAAPRVGGGMPPANLPGIAPRASQRAVEDATPPATIPAGSAQAKPPITIASLRSAQSAEAAEIKMKASPARPQAAGAPAPPLAQLTSVPPIKEYGTDPYREPVE